MLLCLWMIFLELFLSIFLKNKSDATQATARFIADMAPYGSIKTLRTDCGTEYTCSEFKELTLKNKIHLEFSAPYSQHQNGIKFLAWSDGKSQYERSSIISFRGTELWVRY